MSPYFSTVIIFLCFSFAANIILWMGIESRRKYILFLLNKAQPFKRKQRLMSPNESRLYKVLLSIEALKNFDIFPQVPYSSFMDVDSETADLSMRFEVINSYRSDFVVVNKDSSSIIMVIELNDQSHWYNYKKARDLFVLSALKSVNIPCLVLETKDIINHSQIELRVKSIIYGNNTGKQ